VIKFNKGFVQFFKFGIVGVINTCVDMLIFFFLNGVIGVFYTYAQIISYLCGTLNSFLFNKYWTFAKKDTPYKTEMLKFFALNLVALTVSSIIIYVLVQNLGLYVYKAKIIATIFTLIINFTGSKVFVFVSNLPKDKKSKKQEEIV